MNKIDELKAEPVSDQFFSKYLGNNPKIIKYEDLRNYKSLIIQLLPKPIDYLILFVAVDNKLSGHWTCIFRYHRRIYYFCSLGTRPDKSLLWAKKNTRRKLGQKFPHLSYLLNDSLDNHYSVFFNGFPFQKDSPDVATCGRWCTGIIKYLLTQSPKTFGGFKKYIKEQLKRYNLKDMDQLISMMYP